MKKRALPLRRFHPEQDAFVFANLVPGTGIAAVAAVSRFLDRLEALETSAERKASRKADHAALALVEQRGVTKEQRKEIRSLVKWIESTPAQPVDAAQESPREAALLAVYDWVQDWTECARTVITRRDQLIRLGIQTPSAQRRYRARVDPDACTCAYSRCAGAFAGSSRRGVDGSCVDRHGASRIGAPRKDERRDAGVDRGGPR